MIHLKNDDTKYIVTLSDGDNVESSSVTYDELVDIFTDENFHKGIFGYNPDLYIVQAVRESDHLKVKPDWGMTRLTQGFCIGLHIEVRVRDMVEFSYNMQLIRGQIEAVRIDRDPEIWELRYDIRSCEDDQLYMDVSAMNLVDYCPHN